MQVGYTLFLLFSWMFVIVSFLPALPLTHWSVRGFDYVRIQLLAVLSVLLLVGVVYLLKYWSLIIFVTDFFILLSVLHHFIIILPYLSFINSNKNQQISPHAISIISINVYQENTDYNELIELIGEYQPNILLTIETNKNWEIGLSPLEMDYPNTIKIPKENTYGMHLYTNLKVAEIKEHYLISDERPAIEAHLYDSQNNKFVLWGIHPPPPSPTEKPTSRQKDAELMLIAKKIRKTDLPCIVIGDFNNVCWSKTSHLFARVSRLKDARLGRGIYGTFPVTPRFLRAPIDLIFNSRDMKVNFIKTLRDIGSDHLPIFTMIDIPAANTEASKKMAPTLKEEVDEMIHEGHMAAAREGDDSA